jgi:hypothetical protein
MCTIADRWRGCAQAFGYQEGPVSGLGQTSVLVTTILWAVLVDMLIILFAAMLI